MDRRLVGVALLCVTLMVAAAVPRLSFTGAAGRPAPAPEIEPQVGDCVVQTGQSVYVVDCSTRHTAEVALVLPAYQSPGTTTPQSGGFGGRGFSGPCRASAEEYLGISESASATPPADDSSVGSDWQTSALTFNSLTAPRGRPAESAPNWRACLVTPNTPTPTGYVGSIRGVTDIGTLPIELRTCYSLDNTQPAGRSDSSCTTPHSGEVVGIKVLAAATVGRTDLTRDARIVDQCRQLAADRIHASDPTFGGRLTVRLHAQQNVNLRASQNRAAPGAPYGTASTNPPAVQLACSVEVAGSRTLTTSLISLGDQPLPVG